MQGDLKRKVQKEQAGSLRDGEQPLGPAGGGLGGAPGEASQAEGPEPAPHAPSRGLYFIWRRRDPTRAVWRPMETPPGTEMTGVSEAPETRPHGSGVLAVEVLRKVLEAGASQEVPGRAGPRNESWTSQPRAPVAQGDRRPRPGDFIESAFRATLRNPGSSDLWLSDCKVLCRRSPGGSLGIGSVAQPRRTMKRNV